MNVRITKRQHETLLHLVKGFSNAAIASEMCIKQRTVESHVTELLSKFNVENRTQLTAKYISEELIYNVQNVTKNRHSQEK